MTSLVARARALPRATLAASLILVICSAIAFGFVLQRGSLLLPEAPPSPAAVGAIPSAPSPTTAAVASGSPPPPPST